MTAPTIAAIQQALASARRAEAEAAPASLPHVAGVVGVVLDAQTFAAALREYGEQCVASLGEAHRSEIDLDLVRDRFVINSCNGQLLILREHTV